MHGFTIQQGGGAAAHGQGAGERGKTEFFPALESLRGIAALGVAASHALWTHSFHQAGVFVNAWLFVDLFFVLSGFVLAHTYANGLSGPGAVQQFAVRRFFRLYPLHIATLAVFVAAHLVFVVVLNRGPESSGFTAANEPFLTQLFAHLTLTHAAGLTPTTGFNGPSWSISAEAFAYLAFALVAASPFWARGRVFVFAALAVLGLVMLLLISPTRTLFTTFDAGIWRALYGFSIGVMACAALAPARAFFDRRPQFAAPVQALGLVATFAFVWSFGIKDTVTLIAPLLFVVPILSLAAAPQAAPSRFLSAAPLVALGTISYSIYLVHFPIAIAMNEVLSRAFDAPSVVFNAVNYVVVPELWGTVAFFGYAGVVVLASAVTYRLIEAPGRALGRSVFRQSS